MGKFSQIKLTNKGKLLQAKIQAGVTKLDISRVIVGDGYLDSFSNVDIMTELVHRVSDANVSEPTNKIDKDGNLLTEIELRSGNTPFYFREIGLVASDPDNGDILYAYANSGDFADYIPPATESDIVTYVTIITAIASADDVEIKVNLDVGVTREEFEKHVSNKKNPHKVTAKDVELGNVTNESKATMFTDPVFTGVPKAPTAAVGTSTTQIATTEFVAQMLKFAVLTSLTVDVDTEVSRESPGYFARITAVNAKTLIGTPNVTFDTDKRYAAELEDLFVYCDIENDALKVRIVGAQAVPASAIAAQVVHGTVTLI